MAKIVQLRPTAQALPDAAERYRNGDAVAVIALASFVPGCGKTTLAVHLGFQAQRSGAGPVVLLDMTRDGGLGAWAGRRRGRGPPVLPVTPQTLARTLLERQEDGDLVAVVDTPAVESAESLARVAAVADLVVIVCPAELSRFKTARAFADELSCLGVRTLVVAGRVPHDSGSLKREAWVRTASSGLCRTMVRESAEIAAAMARGDTVFDSRVDSDAAREIAGLWEAVRPLSRDA